MSESKTQKLIKATGISLQVYKLTHLIFFIVGNL